MRFNPKARIDTSRVSDGGGRSGGGGGLGGGQIQMPGGMKAGGGVAGIVIILIIVAVNYLMGGQSPAAGGSLDSGQMVAEGADSGRYDNCRTGEDAATDPDCARVLVENSLRDYWAATLPEQAGIELDPATMETFTGAINTGCGQATSAVGPFYCPPDQRIYLDTTFFADVLQQQLNGPAGDFVEPYVIGHEYGHHIQNLMGTMSRVKTQQGPRSDAVRLELQADCYAGMWVKAATSTQDATGEPLILELTDQDIREAIAAASAVGDDKIQQQTQGQVTKETWTHGSAASRMKWFQTGYQQGSLQACDTWAVDTP
ncbi:MAG: neutral zinc metallopeptidase [Nocardioides sp.]